MKVIFSKRAYAGILAETAEKIKTETGGLFLGAVCDDVFYVVEAIDPGPNSVFKFAYFEYDQPYTQHLINKVANLYACSLELVGLWHRHPGSFDQFSGTDDVTNQRYAEMREAGAVSVLVNVDPEFRISAFHVAAPHCYTPISYEVSDSLIPERYLRMRSPEAYFRLMADLTGNTPEQAQEG